MERRRLKTTFLDTSYVVALINKTDEFHQRANELVEEYENTQLVVTDSVLLEIGNSLAREYKHEAVAVIEEFIASRNTTIVRLSETLFGRAFDLYKQYSDKTWGLVDCVSFVVMQEHNVTDALTHDHHFIQAGYRALMRESIN
jgi:predicted nucleic acid-binding protein